MGERINDQALTGVLKNIVRDTMELAIGKINLPKSREEAKKTLTAKVMNAS